MLTASESGSTNDMFCLLNTCIKNIYLADAQTIYFWYITQTFHLKVLPWTLAEVRQSLCRVFVLQPVIEKSPPSSLYFRSLREAPGPRSATPDKVRGEIAGSKERLQRASCLWVSSGSGSLEELRSDTGLCRALCWYIKYRCLSICDASSIFYVSFLTKFCISWYLRSSDLSQLQRILHRQPSSWSLHFIILFSPGILYHFFICP